MERTLNQEERIRRAEEIYNRRRNEYGNYNKRNYNPDNYKLNKEPIDIRKRIRKKLILQIVICMVIYLIIYVLLNSNYFFSEQIHKKIMEYLTYDIQFSKLYNETTKYLQSDESIINRIFNANNTNSDQTNKATENSEDTNKMISEENKISTTTTPVGGAEENTEIPEDKEESDVQYIKKNYSITWPLKGVITSKFGTRMPTTIVTANHYGIDIAGNTGTPIIAAMDGKVTIASSEGEYGKHIQIDNGEVSTLYAHCSAILVEIGKDVRQGEKIAEVGETRESHRAPFAL